MKIRLFGIKTDFGFAWLYLGVTASLPTMIFGEASWQQYVCGLNYHLKVTILMKLWLAVEMHQHMPNISRILIMMMAMMLMMITIATFKKMTEKSMPLQK